MDKSLDPRLPFFKRGQKRVVRAEPEWAKAKDYRGSRETVKRIWVFAATTTAALIAAGAALAAGGSILNGYGGEGGNAVHQVSGVHTGTASGTLPFTGLDLSLVLGGAILLVLIGFAVRRSTRESA